MPPWVRDWGPIIVSILAYAGAGIAWWNAQRAAAKTMQGTLDALVKWSATHESEARQRDLAITHLREIAAAATATAAAQAAQLLLIQQELRDSRN